MKSVIVDDIALDSGPWLDMSPEGLDLLQVPLHAFSVLSCFLCCLPAFCLPLYRLFYFVSKTAGLGAAQQVSIWTHEALLRSDVFCACLMVVH